MSRSKHQNTQAFRAGAWLGRAWRALVRGEAQCFRFLIGHGCPTALAAGLKWIVRFCFLGLLLYSWIAVVVLIVAVLILSKIVAHADLSGGCEEEWRNGPLGFGQYDKDDWRLDPYEPNNPFREQ